MNTEYIYAKFPEYADLFEFLKARNQFPEFGLVVRQAYGKHENILYFVRLTKQLVPERLILICDIEICKGFLRNKTGEEMTKLKNDKIDEIQKAAAKIFGIIPRIIDAEFQLEPVGE